MLTHMITSNTKFFIFKKKKMFFLAASGVLGILVLIIITTIILRPKRELEARSTKSKIYVSRKQNEFKELRLQKKTRSTFEKRFDVLVPPNIRNDVLSDDDDGDYDEENESIKISEIKRKGRWFTFGDNEYEDSNDSDDSDYSPLNHLDTNNNHNIWNPEDQKQREVREKEFAADLRARKDIIRKQREDEEYLRNVTAAVVKNRNQTNNNNVSQSTMAITTPIIPASKTHDVKNIVNDVLSEIARRKQEKIVAVCQEEARRVALVSAQAAKIAYSKAKRYVRVAVAKKNRKIKEKKIQKAKAEALSEVAFREPGKIAVRLMHVFEGVRHEYQYLEKYDSNIAPNFPSVRYKNGLELNVPGSFKIRTFKSTKFGQVFKPLNMIIGTIMEPEEMIQILKDTCVMMSAVRKTKNDVLFRALAVNVVNKILKKAASNQKCSRNLGIASAFLCLRFPVLYGFFMSQLIRECPFFAPICLHTLQSSTSGGNCDRKDAYGFVDSTRTWQSCESSDAIACHGLPRGHGPSPLHSFTSATSIHQTKITPGDHEVVETSLTLFYAGLLTGVNRMSTQPHLYRSYFEKRYGLPVSDGTISSRVSIEIASLERSLGKNTVDILSNLGSDKPAVCDAYDLHILGSKPDVILAASQTAKGTGFGLPYGKTRIWQWTAFWVTHLVDSKFEVPYILPGMITVFVRETKELMLKHYGRQYRRLLNTLRKGLQSRIDRFDVNLKKCGLCFVSSRGQPISDYRKSETAYTDVVLPLFELCS